MFIILSVNDGKYLNIIDRWSPLDDPRNFESRVRIFSSKGTANSVARIMGKSDGLTVQVYCYETYLHNWKLENSKNFFL